MKTTLVIRAILGYAAAVMVILAMAAFPFRLMDTLTRAVAATGIRVDPSLTGGEPARLIDRKGYRITINHPVVSLAISPNTRPFVQVTWTPVKSLPARVSERLDIDGDGRDDLTASFDVPRDATIPLKVKVVPLDPRVLPLDGASRDSFSALIVRVRDGIVVRIPLAH